MMKKLFAIAVLAMTCLAGWADSPLTSTHFAEAYADEPMVQMAAGAQGEFSTTLLNYLANPKAPVDVRLAVVNQLGWSFEGQSTGDQLLQYLMGRHNCANADKLAKKLDAGTLAVYAYAKAMSNYFDVTQACELAHKAVKKDKSHSFSVAMAAALIDAQIYLDNDWSQIYPVVAGVLNNGALRLDMRQQAIDNIMEYINLYQEY